MTRRFGLDDLAVLRIPATPAISPDGTQVAYTLSAVDSDADADRRTLWLVDAAGGEPRRLTEGAGDRAPTWSPDGRTLAFLRGGEGERAQVWLLPLAGGEPRRLTELPLGAGTPVWSPDGTRIAFTAPVDLAAPYGQGGDDAAPIVIDRLGYKEDGAGLLRSVRRHVFVVEVASGRAEQVTRGDWHAGAPAWSPDGGRLAFPAALSRDADLTGESAAYVVDLAGPDRTPRPVGETGGVAGPVCWTPDGAALVVAGQREPRIGNQRLLWVPLDGGPARDLTAGLDRNVMPGSPAYPGGLPQFARDGRTLVFCARDHGCTHVYALDVASGTTPWKLAGGPRQVLAGLSVAAAADRYAVVLTDAATFGEVAVGGLAEPPRAVTSYAPGDVELYAAEEREFPLSAGGSVPGWLIRDPSAARPGPLLLDVHGGPHNAWSPVADHIHAYHQVLAARGWTILLVNPRGSDGYGEAYLRGVVGGWGEADAPDFLEPIDQLVAEGIADPDRLTICGYSYGGYTTCYLTGRTGRFAAAVAGGVVSDLVSMVGTADEGHGLAVEELLTEAPPTPEAVAAWSPYAQVNRVRTPTLILHGAADDRCPVGQAEQWFAALRARGVPTRLVLYPGASHLFIFYGRPSHRLDYNRRIVDWLTAHTTPARRVARPALDGGRLRRLLGELTERHGVPGAALGVLRVADPADPSGDERAEVACGVLSTATEVAATPDSLFQIGSITKVWTATLAMQLVDEGALDLDQPIAEVLPDLRLADAEAAKQVTMRHLLTHTSGIDGDVFTDTGRGDDCVQRYVAGLADVAQNHPLGATLSYCNSGYVLAGRVIEKLTGTTWDTAVRKRVCEPLGLRHTVTLAEEALLFRAAVGHVGESPAPAPVWQLPRALGPAGLISSTVGDVLAFARMHLADGRAPDGRQVLSARGALAMRAKHADMPDPLTLGDSWGLGWTRMGWDGERLVGHNGGTLGQSAYLRLLPGHGLAVTLLTNADHPRRLYEELFREVVGELTGVAMPAPMAPAAAPPAVDIAPYAGTYERAGMRIEIDEGPVLRETLTGPFAELVPRAVQEHPMTPVRDGLFLVHLPEADGWAPVTFYRIADGTSYVHFGVRATPKVVS